MCADIHFLFHAMENTANQNIGKWKSLNLITTDLEIPSCAAPDCNCVGTVFSMAFLALNSYAMLLSHWYTVKYPTRCLYFLGIHTRQKCLFVYRENTSDY